MSTAVFPAYAGVSLAEHLIGDGVDGLPRLRGGEPLAGVFVLLTPLSSPPTRG